jgi:REP element-mobilizing transposase RayT
MTIARSQIVDVQTTRYYHCISKVVRGAFLMGVGYEHRKRWVEQRLEHLANNYAVSVAGFAIMDNHLHVLVRLDPEIARSWSDEEVLRRWANIYPPNNMDISNKSLLDSWIKANLANEKLVADYRERLQTLGWFMKSLKEPLARMANHEDKCDGAFWQGRYKSIAVIDDEALLATCLYIDLNPLAAGIAATPETSKNTSFRQRIEHAKRKDALDRLKAAADGAIHGSNAAKGLEQDHWLTPIEDRRNTRTHKSDREGLLETFSLGSYMLLIDYTARIYRKGKARLNAGTKEIFDRIGSAAETFGDRVANMLRSTKLRGNCFAGRREQLEPVKQRRKQRVANLTPQLARPD